jgi:hypothetical protein
MYYQTDDCIEMQLLRESYGCDLCFGASTMIAVVKDMASRGMLTDASEPNLPNSEAFGVHSRDIWHLDRLQKPRHSNAAENSPLDAYAQATWDVISASTGNGGIPHFKLEASEGWYVTPEEIEGALCRAARRGTFDRPSEGVLGYPDANGISPWQHWLRFLGGARDHGGFTVRWR